MTTLRDEPRTEPDLEIERLSDLGNARRFARLHRHHVRWIKVWKKFYVYTAAGRWAEDTTGQVMAWAVDVPRELYRQAAEALDERRKPLARWALQSENLGRLNAAVELLKSQPGISVGPETFDTNPWLLNCTNGTLELDTLTLRPHRADDLLTKMTACAFDPEATSATWQRHLDENVKDPATIRTLQTFAGYSLTGSTAEERFLFAHGPGGGGKSTTLEALTATWSDYATVISFDTLLAHKRDPAAPSDDIKAMRGARLVAATETDAVRGWAAGVVKHLTGSDTLRARGLHENSFQFRPQFKLWLGANARPRISASDTAFWDRLLEVPFPTARPRGSPDCDSTIKTTLIDPTQSGPAILAWAVAGLRAWQRDGLAVSALIDQTTAEYQASQDTVGQFLQACCQLSPTVTEKPAALRGAYLAWCAEAGLKPAAGDDWTKRLATAGIDEGRSGSERRRVKIGVRLLEPPPQPHQADDEEAPF